MYTPVGDRVTTLLASATRTTAQTTTEAQVVHHDWKSKVLLMLDLSDAQAAAGDTLDVKVQGKFGSVWVDICAFTQILGNGTDSQKLIVPINCTSNQANFDGNTALTAGNERDLMSDILRVVHTITNGGTGTQSFTFGVFAYPM